MKARDRERQARRGLPRMIDVIGNRDGVVVLVGGKGGAQILVARMIAPGVCEIAKPNGSTATFRATDGTGAFLGQLWDALATCAGVFGDLVVGLRGPILPDGSLVAAAWAEHRRRWLAEHAV